MLHPQEMRHRGLVKQNKWMQQLVFICQWWNLWITIECVSSSINGVEQSGEKQ